MSEMNMDWGGDVRTNYFRFSLRGVYYYYFSNLPNAATSSDTAMLPPNRPSSPFLRFFYIL